MNISLGTAEVCVLPTDNFVILYIFYLEEKIVHIVTVMYNGRDIGEQLKYL